MTIALTVPIPETIHPTDEVAVHPEYEQVAELFDTLEQPGLQEASPAEAFFIQDAVDAASPELRDQYPAQIVDSTLDKVHSAALFSVTLSMKDSMIGAVVAPAFVSEETLERLGIDGMDGEAKRGPKTSLEEEDVPFVPNFDDEEELTGRTGYLVENAMRLCINDLNSEQRNERAKRAIAELAARDTEVRDQVFEARSASERTACESHTIDELTEARAPVHLTHRESAFVAEAVRNYDPEAYRQALAHHPRWGLMANVQLSNVIITKEELVPVAPLVAKTGVETEGLPRLPLASIGEVTGYESPAARAAVWVAGLVSRNSIASHIRGRAARLAESIYLRATVYRSILIQ